MGFVKDLFDIENGVLRAFNGNGKPEAVIPEGVSEIYEYAFAEHGELEKIVIPEGVTKIGQNAFMCCSELREIVLPSTLERVERFAFWDCGELGHIEFGSGLKYIGNSAFRGCDMLKRAVIPDTVEYIGESAFSDCCSLEEINIPKSMDMIRKRVFSDCQALERVFIPENVRTIDDYAFESCLALSEVGLSEGLVDIGRHAFTGCRSLEKIDIPDSVNRIGGSAFDRTPLVEDCKDEFMILGSGILVVYNGSDRCVKIPDGVRHISECAFAHCEDIEEIIIPETVSAVGDYAFEHCTSLEKVEFRGDSVKYLGNRVFIDCVSLRNLRLPESITHMGSEILYNTGVSYECADEFLIISDKYLVEYSGDGESCTVPDGVEIIASGAFAGRVNLKEVKIPDSVAVIGEGAFRWCGNLRTAEIPVSAVQIGEEAFGSSEGLEVVWRGENFGEIVFGERAFLKNTRFTLSDGGFVRLLSDTTAGVSPLIKFLSSPTEDNFNLLEYEEYKIYTAVHFGDKFAFCRDYLSGHVRETLCLAVSTEDENFLKRFLKMKIAVRSDLENALRCATEINSKRSIQLLREIISSTDENFS